MKILAIASIGGHWIQLLRLRPAFEGAEVEFMSTNAKFSTMVPGHRFYSIPDSNRKDKVKMIKSFYNVFSIIFKAKPDVIITTGAAPGLMGIVAGRLLGVKTIWVDSIANVKHLSMSGKIASKFANYTYTQWPDIANSKVLFKGNVLS